MKLAKTAAASFLTLILCAIGASQALAQQTPLKPGAIKGETLSLTKARNYAFCEIYVGFGAGPNPALQCYNSTGTTGPDSGCPAEAFAALSPKKLAADLGGTVAVLNPVNQSARKWWVMDELYLYAAGETYDFSGVKATWVAEMGLRDLEKAGQASKIPYQPLTNRQLSKWVFKKGNPVFLLRAPEGKVYVMQAVTTIVDKDLSYEQLPQLGSKLKKLPPGWKYEVKTLTEDLVFDVSKATPSGLKHLTLDEFANVYLGCGFDEACNYIP
jgi:hypothetical protein